MADAEELFAEYLAALEDGGGVDFEELCARHPEVAGELRQLKDLEERFASVISGGALSGSGSALTSALSELVRSEEREVERPETERYDVIGEVGRGGMGVVLEVFDRALRRRSAMKVVRPGGGQQQMRRLARFLEEAQLTGQLEHPGIVPVHELGTDSAGCTYFTMRLVEGVTLGHVFEEVRKGSAAWTLPRSLGVLQRVCETLAYAHSRGVIHRDLKPANVMVGRFGETYVMDWGLATPEGQAPPVASAGGEVRDGARLAGGLSELDESLSRSGLGLTLAGDVVGTPAYMAPEQAGVGSQPVGPRSDVYALGAMLYELLSGSAPYVEQGHVLGMLEALRKGPPKDLAKRVDDVAPELVAIAAKAMQRDPAQRYADMVEFSEDLRAYLEGRVVRAYESGRFAELRKWVRRNRALSSALVAVLILAVVGVLSTGIVRYVERRNVQRMADLSELTRLLEEEAELPRGSIDAIPDYERWIERARSLREREPLHRAKLEELRRRYTADQTDWLEGRLVEHLETLDGLDGSVAGRGALTRVLESLAVARGRQVVEASPDWRAAWDTAAVRMADNPLYAGWRLEPVAGLKPAEFVGAAQLLSAQWLPLAAAPANAGPGSAEVGELRDAPSLILIPGGDGRPPFWMAERELSMAQLARLLPLPDPGERGGEPGSGLPDGKSAHALVRRVGLELPTFGQFIHALTEGGAVEFPWSRRAAEAGIDEERLLDVLNAHERWDEYLTFVEPYMLQNDLTAFDARPRARSAWGLRDQVGSLFEFARLVEDDFEHDWQGALQGRFGEFVATGGHRGMQLTDLLSLADYPAPGQLGSDVSVNGVRPVLNAGVVPADR